MTEATIRNLLRQVSSIRSKYREIEQLTGERFNVFKVLDVSTQEVRMHSALIGELLNPKGSHGCGEIFLNLFLNLRKAKHEAYYELLERFDAKAATLVVEFHIPGGINADNTQGGRIDLLLSSEGSQIIIENKIYAGDQNNQLIRYHNFNKSALLFYLTLDGQQPSDLSCKDEINGVCLKRDVDFVCISYKDDIVHWLQQCIKEAVSLPLLRETIQQYIYLIKSLTYQTTNHKMREEIIKAIAENDDYMESAFTIANLTDHLKAARSKEISEKVAGAVQDRELPCTISQWFHQFQRLEYYPTGWNNHLIGFTDDGGLMFGVKRVKDTIKTLQIDDIRPVIGNDWRTSSWWLCYKAHNIGNFNLFSANPWLQKNEDEIVRFIVEQIELLIARGNSLPEEKRKLL